MADGTQVLFADPAGFAGLTKREKRERFGSLDVVMTGFAGLSGSVILAKRKAKELSERYPAFFMENAVKQEALLWQIPKGGCAGKPEDEQQDSFSAEEIAGIYLLSTGGVFAGLWNMAKEGNVGLEIDLKKIPVKQETVEICNYFRISPYQLYAGGSCLIFSENGGRLKKKLSDQGICAEVIGFTTEKNDRIVTNGKERRFLEKRYEEALYSVLPECDGRLFFPVERRGGDA